MTDRWWHYTKGVTLFHIINDGQIRRSAQGVTGGERHCVWFSRCTTWEGSATMGVVGQGVRRDATIAEMVTALGPLVRLEVSVQIARYTWQEHRQIGQIEPRSADVLEEAGRRLGADPGNWRVSYDDVSTKDVLGIEASEDGASWSLIGLPRDDGFILDRDFVEKVRAAVLRLSANKKPASDPESGAPQRGWLARWLPWRK